jgi:aryl-alcohol dehydrogenase-like predicted oxidoreductase
MGMSSYYGAADWDECVATIQRAVELGVTLIDTANGYGAGHNEVLVGRGIAGRRDEIQLATKTGIDNSGGNDARYFRGQASYIKQSALDSLLRLGVDHIDLYYLHRPPEDVPIEEAVSAMAELVTEGKVRHLGLSEVDGDLLRRAYSVHPIAAVQSEYSLWARGPEASAVPVMSELGVGLVPYSPLGRGFLTSEVQANTLAASDFRSRSTRFSGAGAQLSQDVVDAVRQVASDKGCQPAQVALAWVQGRGDVLGVPVVPIPGTKRSRWVEQNVAALDVELTEAELAYLDPLGARAATTVG